MSAPAYNYQPSQVVAEPLDYNHSHTSPQSSEGLASIAQHHQNPSAKMEQLAASAPAASAPGANSTARLGPTFNIPPQPSRDIEKFHSPDDVAIEAGGVMRPTKQAIPDLPKPHFIKRMFGKKGKKGDEVEEEKEKHYIPAAIPDPSREEMGAFPLFPSQLNGLVDPKSVDKLTEMGGLTGLAEKLHTDLKTGLNETGAPTATSIETRRTSTVSTSFLPKSPRVFFT